MGWLSIYSSVYNESHQNIFDISQRYGKQMIFIGSAFIIAFSLLLIDSRTYSFFAYIIYIISMLMLLAVLVLARKIKGAQSWYELFGLQVQPAEFAKFATSLALAKFLSSFNIKVHTLKNIFIYTLIIMTPVALIILQPDVGSALVYIAFVFVLYREGLSVYILLMGVLSIVLFIFSLFFEQITIIITLITIVFLLFGFISSRLKEQGYGIAIFIISFLIVSAINYVFKLKINPYFIILIALGLASLTYLFFAYRLKIAVIYFYLFVLFGSIAYTYSVDYIFDNVLSDHQRTRINVLFGRVQDLKGSAYNQYQSLVAIGSGGLSGKGFLQGTQTKYHFVPEQSTDFIFCSVGEEWGFIGTFIVVGTYVFLLIRLIFLAERQRSIFSRVYGYSVASILFMHIAINVSMTIGIAPVIGIPLPFFSYGGSSLWSFTILLFIFLRLDASRFELL